MADQARCDMHGGKSPQALAAAERRQAETRLRSECARLGIPVEGTPAEALGEALALARGAVRWAADRLLEAQEQADTVGLGPLGAVIQRGARGPDIAPLVRLFNEALDRVARIARLAWDPATMLPDGGPMRIIVEGW